LSKYSLVSAFQASGSVDMADRSAPLLTHISMGPGQRKWAEGGGMQRRIAFDHLKTELRSHGNGLVMAFDRRSERIVAGGCQRGTVRTWDLRAERNVVSTNVLGNSAVITALTIPKTPEAGSENVVYYGGSDGVIGSYDQRARDGGRRTLGRHSAAIVSTGMCPDRGSGALVMSDNCRELLVSADMSGEILLWDTRQGASAVEVGRIAAHKGMITTMATHPSSRIIASGSTNNCVKMFGADNSVIGTIHKHGSGILARRIPVVTALAFQPDARLLAVGCADASMHFYGRL
jgi:WD40 repeat protein